MALTRPRRRFMPRRAKPAPNPYFNTPRAAASRQKPRGPQILIITSVVVGLAILTGCYFLFSSHYFSVADPAVEANSNSINGEINTAVHAYLNQTRLGFFSASNYWLLNERGLHDFIAQRLSDTAKLETLMVKKSYPNHLTITASVYQPFVRIKSSTSSSEYVLDQKGIVTGTYEAISPDVTTNTNVTTEETPIELPLVYDANSRIIQIGKQMASADFITAVDTLYHHQEQYGLSFESYSIPEIHCPVIPAVIDESDNQNSNSNANTNSSINGNSNSSTTINKNTNTAPECDRASLILDTAQVNAVLTDGPDVYFSFAYDLTEELDRLRLFLESKRAELGSIHYIDVRIPERIYYQ